MVQGTRARFEHTALAEASLISFGPDLSLIFLVLIFASSSPQYLNNIGFTAMVSGRKLAHLLYWSLSSS